MNDSREGRPAGTIAVVARDVDYRELLASGLRQRNRHVISAADTSELEKLEADCDMAIVDIQATGVLSAPEGLTIPIVVIASGPAETDMHHLRSRAVEVLTKPVAMAELADLVGGVLARRTLRNTTNAATRPTRPATARSMAMRLLEEQVLRLRGADCAILIQGETGTGKTVLARRIHTLSARSSRPFVDLNCSALTGELVESELFGHERGSFTGAHTAKQGLFEAAHSGTLFLDEIGDIDLRVQPRILKVLDESRFRRVGDVRERTVDVRLIAATHHDLERASAQKTFRADLYYRISTIRLWMPALRERREDILPLAQELLARVGSSVMLSPNAQERLVEHDWPGNIRQLKNAIESAVILRRGDTITADDLPLEGSSPLARSPDSTRSVKLLAAEATAATSDELERAHIRMVLAAEKGRVEAAARRLGIPRSTLYWKLKRYGITPCEHAVASHAEPRVAKVR